MLVVGIFFFSISFLNARPLVCSEFVGFKSFNCMMKGSDGKSEMQSGPEGNIYVLHNSSRTAEKKIDDKRLDLDAIHDLLSQNADGVDHSNKATAAFTLIMQKKLEQNKLDHEKFYAVSIMLTQQLQTEIQHAKTKPKKFENEEQTLPTAFKSCEENLSALYKDFKKRCQHDLFRKNPRLERIRTIINALQEIKLTIGRDRTADCDDLMEVEERLDSFDKLNNGNSDKESELVKKHYLAKELEQLNSENKIKLYPREKSESELRKKGGYGPIGDSEQHLLHYLENELFLLTGRLSSPTGKYLDLVISHTRIKNKDYYHDDYDGVEELFNEPSKSLGEKKSVEFVPLGCFIHIFSTNECCEFCATSLRYEFFYAVDNFVSRIKEDIKTRRHGLTDLYFAPFFVVLVSYKRRLANINDYALRPRGIISSSELKCFREDSGDLTSGGMINLQKLIDNKVVAFKQATYPDLVIKDGKIVPLSYLRIKK